MSAAVAADKQWFGHPRGLSTLFFTEMWERASYYGMRAILILFMVDSTTGGMAIDTATAAAIYGLYTAAVYLLALPGGWMADHVLGHRKAVLLGGALIAAGHFTMAVPSVPTFYTGLILIVLGTGLLKPNVSVMVGHLYSEGSARRDSGFTLFYMGINVGALGGPLICGYLGEEVNWHYGFGAAGVGMVLGLIQYWYGGKYLGDAGLLKQDPKAVAQRAQDWRKFFLGVGLLAVVGAILLGLQYAGKISITALAMAQWTGYVIVGMALLYFSSVLAFGKITTAEKKRVFVIFLFFVGAALFWSGFEQAGSSMNLFAQDLTDRVVFGYEVPASWSQSINPLFILLLAPVFAWLWVKLGSREPSIPAKFGYGLGILGIGFLVLAWGSTYTSAGLVSPMWLIVTYFLHTTGELCLSPVGLSSVSKLSPKSYVGQMMGTWFMGAALGNLIAGLVAGYIEALPLPQLFGTVAAIVIVSGALFLVLAPLINKKMIGNLDEKAEAA